MSIRQLTSEIASLNKDIANLQEKYAKEKKLESDKKLKIVSIQKTITKSTSASMLTAKQKQIAQLENEIAQLEDTVDTHKQSLQTADKDASENDVLREKVEKLEQQLEFKFVIKMY